MRLSNKAIIDFKKIYFVKYGLEITDDKANDLGIQLLQLMELIYKPIPKSFYEK